MAEKIRIILFILLTTTCISNSIAQTWVCDTINGYYTSLDSALKEPEKVKCLDLRSKGYKKFPKSILKFTNLVCLDLSAKDYVSPKEKTIDTTRIIAKDTFHGCRVHVTWLEGIDNPNEISSLPRRIIKLKKLKCVNLIDTKVYEKDVVWIRKKRPDIDFWVWSENDKPPEEEK